MRYALKRSVLKGFEEPCNRASSGRTKKDPARESPIGRWDFFFTATELKIPKPVITVLRAYD